MILLAEYICFTHNKGGAVVITNYYNNNLDLKILLSGCFINNTGSDDFDGGVISLWSAQVTFMNLVSK